MLPMQTAAAVAGKAATQLQELLIMGQQPGLLLCNAFER